MKSRHNLPLTTLLHLPSKNLFALLQPQKELVATYGNGTDILLTIHQPGPIYVEDAVKPQRAYRWPQYYFDARRFTRLWNSDS